MWASENAHLYSFAVSLVKFKRDFLLFFIMCKISQNNFFSKISTYYRLC